MSNRYDHQFTFNPHNKATILDCNFIVDSTNSNATGVSSLNASGRIKSVFMNSNPDDPTATSVFLTGATLLTVSSTDNLVVGMAVTDTTTGGNLNGATVISAVYPDTKQILISIAATGDSASSPGDTLTFTADPALVGNPNPDAGIIIVNLDDNYNKFYAGLSSTVTPLSGSDISVGLTVGTPYVITLLSNSTAAQWHTAGVPSNITPALGVAFIAQATSVAGGGKVQALKAGGTGILSTTVVGNPNVMNSNGALVLGAGNGMQIMMACYKDAATDVPVLAAPADDTLISLVFYMNNSAYGV